jgi:prepilin signal peptidase PulO-like enzyme (type II secretory pathway)
MFKYLITPVVFLLAAGLLWPALSRLGLGRLPGDGYCTGKGRRNYFPFAGSLVLSRVAVLLFGWSWQ